MIIKKCRDQTAARSQPQIGTKKPHQTLPPVNSGNKASKRDTTKRTKEAREKKAPVPPCLPTPPKPGVLPGFSGIGEIGKVGARAVGPGAAGGGRQGLAAAPHCTPNKKNPSKKRRKSHPKRTRPVHRRPGRARQRSRQPFASLQRPPRARRQSISSPNQSRLKFPRRPARENKKGATTGGPRPSPVTGSSHCHQGNPLSPVNRTMMCKR